jgi:hypothetical protein
MHYDLLVQSMTPGVAYDPAPAEAAFDAKGALLLPDGSRRLRLKHGDIELRRLVEAGAVMATEVKVPISDKPDLVRETLVETVGVAQALGLKVVDPQLARSVVLNDEAAVADTFLRTADFAGRYSGVSAAVSDNFGQLDPALKPGTKAAIVIVCLGIALYLFLERLTG